MLCSVLCQHTDDALQLKVVLSRRPPGGDGVALPTNLVGALSKINRTGSWQFHGKPHLGTWVFTPTNKLTRVAKRPVVFYHRECSDA